MATTHIVDAEEYLHTAYEPDAEYVEGTLATRPMPQKDHSKIQKMLLRKLDDAGNPIGFQAWPEQRVRTTTPPHSRYRVPDICVTYGEPEEQVFTQPPHLCVEILSPEDNALDLRAKVEEYLAFGVLFVWVIDPGTSRGEVYTLQGITRVTDGIFRAAPLSIDLHHF